MPLPSTYDFRSPLSLSPSLSQWKPANHTGKKKDLLNKNKNFLSEEEEVGKKNHISNHDVPSSLHDEIIPGLMYALLLLLPSTFQPVEENLFSRAHAALAGSAGPAEVTAVRES